MRVGDELAEVDGTPLVAFNIEDIKAGKVCITALGRFNSRSAAVAEAPSRKSESRVAQNSAGSGLALLGFGRTSVPAGTACCSGRDRLAL